MAASGIVLPTRTIPIPVSAIQTPTSDGSNHSTILRQVKESIEVAARQRGDPGFSYVRANELVALGLATMVNGALQLAGGAVAKPLTGTPGSVSGPGGGGVGIVGAIGPPGPQGVPGQDGYDGEDGLTIPGLPGLPGLPGTAGAPGTPGAAGTNAITHLWPDDPDDPLIVPGPAGIPGIAGIAGTAGAAGAPGAPGTNAITHLWPDDPDDSLIVPGPAGVPGAAGTAGTAGAAGAPGTNAVVYLWPEDVDDVLFVPGINIYPGQSVGLVGLVAVSGVSQNYMRADASLALDQGIAPTWLATHTFNPSVGPAIVINSSPGSPGIGINGSPGNFCTQYIGSSTGVSQGLIVGAGLSATDVVFDVRNQALSLHKFYILGLGGGTVFGNTTDNAPVSFMGSGLVTMNGAVLMSKPVTFSSIPVFTTVGVATATTVGGVALAALAKGFITVTIGGVNYGVPYFAL